MKQYKIICDFCGKEIDDTFFRLNFSNFHGDQDCCEKCIRDVVESIDFDNLIKLLIKLKIWSEPYVKQ